MKKIFNRVKDWCIEYKKEIKTCYIILVTVIAIFICLFTCILITMCNDLVDVIETKNNEIKRYKEEIEYLTIKRNEAESERESIIQTYEDSIPKQQYINDIEYLESVILELTTQYKKIYRHKINERKVRIN